MSAANGRSDIPVWEIPRIYQPRSGGQVFPCMQFLMCLGFREVSPGSDQLTYRAYPPHGWTRECPGHQQWELFDEHGCSLLLIDERVYPPLLIQLG